MARRRVFYLKKARLSQNLHSGTALDLDKGTMQLRSGAEASQVYFFFYYSLLLNSDKINKEYEE